jgi:hypothetical protein
VRFPIIYADPAWRYKQQGNGAAAKHYPTLTTRDICALPVGALAADDALLFLWATFPNERDAHRVIDAWGFTYKTAAFVWVKLAKNGRPMFGTGSYTRANAEVCLLATRGQHAARLVRNHSVSQIVLAPRHAPLGQAADRPRPHRAAVRRRPPRRAVRARARHGLARVGQRGPLRHRPAGGVRCRTASRRTTRSTIATRASAATSVDAG